MVKTAAPAAARVADWLKNAIAQRRGLASTGLAGNALTNVLRTMSPASRAFTNAVQRPQVEQEPQAGSGKNLYPMKKTPEQPVQQPSAPVQPPQVGLGSIFGFGPKPAPQPVKAPAKPVVYAENLDQNNFPQPYDPNRRGNNTWDHIYQPGDVGWEERKNPPYKPIPRGH